MDSKAMSDLTPIIHTFTTTLIPLDNKSGISNNEILFKFESKIPDYIIDCIIEYQDKSTVKYEVWRMEGCFRRFITEGLRI